ncbi:hypothetical protein NECAME_08661, partial [Necator americanus]
MSMKSMQVASAYMYTYTRFNPRYDFPDAEPRMIYGNRTLVYPSFDELLFTVSMKICSEIRAKCNETSIRQGVKEMLSVVEKVHGLRSWISHFDGHQWLRLSELNDQLSSANEKLVEKLIREIFASFKERIKENKWMTREQKE